MYISFSQLHIDVARNATDDFNLFHDPKKWQLINQNPFSGPIVLGFQLESLIEHFIKHYREKHSENKLIDQFGLRYSNYQFNFANAVKTGEPIEVNIKKSQFTNLDDAILSNRVSLKANGKLVLIGYKKESKQPMFLPDIEKYEVDELLAKPDRSYLKNRKHLRGKEFFLKRKYMNTSNAKNFLCGSLADQHEYFDELNDKATFPEIFPCSLISCALLEKAHSEKHDFERNPMVYTAHKICIDRVCLNGLKSNDALHILVKPMLQTESPDPDDPSQQYECYGVIHNNEILFRGIISLTPLTNILKSLKK